MTFRKLVLLCFCFLSLTAFVPQKKKGGKVQEETPAPTDYKKIGAPLPAIRAVGPKGTVFTEKEIDTTGNFFLMLFNPTCGHCEDATRMLEKHLDLFRDNQILLLSAAGMMPYMDYFDATTKVYQYPKIQVGVDSAGVIEKTFIYNSLPQINIYDKDHKLLKIFTGDVSIDSLRPYIR